MYEGSAKSNIRGVLLTKSLILLNPETRRYAGPVLWTSYSQLATRATTRSCVFMERDLCDRTVGDLRSTLVKPVLVGPETKLPDLLNMFQSGLCQMALVTSQQSDVQVVQNCWRTDAPLPLTALSHIITMDVSIWRPVSLPAAACAV